MTSMKGNQNPLAFSISKKFQLLQDLKTIVRLLDCHRVVSLRGRRSKEMEN